MPFGVFFDSTITVYSSASSRDSGGGTSTAYSVRQSGVKCCILSPVDRTQDRFSQEQLIGEYTISTESYTGIQRGDKVVVTVGPTLVGESFHITGIKTQPGSDFLGIETFGEYTAERVR